MPELITLDELSQRLRFSKRTIYKMLDAGDIPAIKIGNKWRFETSAVDDWIRGKSRRRNIKVLVIDDEPAIGALFKRLLEKDPFDVVAVENGEAGLIALGSRVPDMVFLDLLMPGMDGAQVLESIRKTNPDLPVVIISSYPDSSLMEKVLENGPITILKKPLCLNDIKLIVGSLAKTRS